MSGYRFDTFYFTFEALIVESLKYNHFFCIRNTSNRAQTIFYQLPFSTNRGYRAQTQIQRKKIFLKMIILFNREDQNYNFIT